MKKNIYIGLALSAMALAVLPACNNEEEDLFDDSAANRLAAAKAEVGQRLVADGGKWVMEYFANSDEPGYLFGMEFKPSGAVNIAANHKWIDGKYTEDNSMWEMIADNGGPVLSFNSYNEVFHIFSSPEDITGPDAPTNPDRPNADGTPGDINETGYGHSGDYEFTVMEGDSSHDLIRLLGKKRGYNIWMHRLPADTDIEAYLTHEKEVTDNMFAPRFPTHILVDGATGERFVVNKAASGVMEVYPEAGDSVTQTVKHNFIMTSDGVRFCKTFAVPRADEAAADLELTSLHLQDDGTFKSDDGVTLELRYTLPHLMLMQGYIWTVDFDAAGGEMATHLAKIKSDWYGATRRQLTGLSLMYYNLDKRFGIQFVETGSGAASILYRDSSENEDGSLSWKISSTEGTTNGKSRVSRVASLAPFITYINSVDFVAETDRELCPDRIKFVNKNDASDYFTVVLK